MKRSIMTASLSLLVAVATYAGTITWIGPTTISDDADVETDGTSIFAYTGGSAATVNEVAFTPALTSSLNNHYLQLTGFTGANAGAFTTTSNNYASLSAEYKNILKGATYNSGAVTTVTLKNLVVDRNYTVQIWVQDPRSGAVTSRYEVVDTTGPELHYNDSHAEGGVGAYAVGTFTADAATQSFTLDGDASTQLNAIQLRVESIPLSADTYWDANGATAGFGTAGGTWGSDVNWSTNALGSSAPDQPVNTTASNVLHFGTAATGLDAGSINVTGDQSFESISFGVASGPIAITNGTLGFTTPTSTIRLNSITNTISSALTPGGSLAIRSLRPVICDGFPTTGEKILFANATLADYTGAESMMGGAWIASGSTTPTPATVYHWVNDGTNASFQVQTYDGGHTKVVKIALRQSGLHIAGRAVYAKHCSPDGNILGFDFDGGGTGSTVATWFNANGYGVTELKLLPYDDRFTQHRYREFLNTTPQTIATDANLDDFTTAECFMAGGSVNDDVQPASTFYFVNDGSNATFQVQCYDDVYTKCVKVELTQAGSDIQARLLYARYIGGNNLGHNFDISWNNSGISTGINAGGYGVRSIRLNKGQSTLVLTAESEYEGLIDLTASTLKLNGLLGSGSMSGSIVNNGAIVCDPPQNQQITGMISGSGSFTVNGPNTGGTITYNSTLTTSYAVIAQNKTLAEYGNASGIISGANVEGGSAVVNPYFFENDGTTATVQLQVYNGGHTKVVKVEFIQAGTDIQAKVLYSKHCNPTANNVGTDYDDTGLINNYALTQLSLLPISISLSGNNTYSGGTVVNGGELQVTTVSSLPDRGGIVVNSGNLLLDAPPNNGINSVVGGMNNPITVFAEGTLTLVGIFNAGYNRPITIDGGILHSTSGIAAHNDNYANNVTLKNGAQVTGNPIQVGHISSATITVEGSVASTIESGICLVNSSDTLTLNVADVTGDDNADLNINGVMNDWSQLYINMPIFKTGAGTVSLSGINTHIGVINIHEGALALDGNSTLNNNNSIVLNGGTLDMGDFANTAGTLAIGASGGTLALGSGALSFADSSAIAWSGTLSLTNTLVEQTVRFGTDKNGLTIEQLEAIEYLDGITVRLNGDGYLTARPQGTVILVK